jgi:hypothetical protein
MLDDPVHQKLQTQNERLQCIKDSAQRSHMEYGHLASANDITCHFDVKLIQ